MAEIVAALGIARDDVVEARWVANGPAWIGVLLRSADEVLAVEPGVADLDIGVVGFHGSDAPEQIEVRGFFSQNGTLVEDPVTGSLNASLAEWLVGDGRLRAPYVTRQGTALGRRGRVHVTRDDAGGLWISGAT